MLRTARETVQGAGLCFSAQWQPFSTKVPSQVPCTAREYLETKRLVQACATSYLGTSNAPSYTYTRQAVGHTILSLSDAHSLVLSRVPLHFSLADFYRLDRNTVLIRSEFTGPRSPPQLTKLSKAIVSR